MSSLPQIGSGQLMTNGDTHRNAEVRSTLDFDVTNGTASRRGSTYPRPPSIVTVNSSLPSIHDSRESQRRKARSRSLDPSATDASQTTAKKRRENESRSKSHDPRAKEMPRAVMDSFSESEELNENEHVIHDETASDKARKVRFSDSSIGSPMPNGSVTNGVGAKATVLKTDKVNHRDASNERPHGDIFHASGNKQTSSDSNIDKRMTVPHRRSPFNYDKFARKPDNKEVPTYRTRTRSPRREYKKDWNVNKKTIPDTNKKEQVQVYSKKYQLKNWAETSSDPGPVSKSKQLRSIDNDQFIKGRPVDPRQPGFLRQQGSDQARQDERPRAADRGGRHQSDKDVREGQHTSRSVNSAPSKDREAPVPKLNSFMKGEKSDKEAANRDRQAQEIATKHQAQVEIKPPDKAVVERDKGEMSDKGRIERPKETDKRESERKEKQLNLPPDDHGPAYSPTVTEPPPTDNDLENKENFNYYASINKTPREKPKPEVPPLQLNTKAPKEKSFSNRVTRSDNMQLISVSTDKSKLATGETDIDTNKKRREVTIIDPKDLRKKADEVEEEAFNKEYEYAHNEERRHKDFEDMDDDERIEFFKATYRMKPEQIRELTFHPKTNEPKIIHKTYTGIDAADWEMAPDSARIKSGRRPKSQHKNAYKKVMVIPTYQRKDFMLSRLQGKIYHHISKVYGSSPRDNREKQFYEKLAQIQLDEYNRRYQMLERNERKRLESLFRQREQLKQLRKKFEKDAWRRFMTQYVTSKVVESEFSNRKDYGLPNSLDKDLHARRKRMDDIDLSTKEKMNKRRFEHLFKFNTGPDFKVKGKPLKFEGIDTVYIDTEDESGEHVSQRQDVAQLIKEARLLLSQAEMDTPRETKQGTKFYKQPPRQVQDTRNRNERPRHHRSRERRPTESDQTPPRRSKSRTKTPKAPKTIKDVILKRQSQPINRYRTSEFLKPSNKPKPTRASNESLHRAVNRKVEQKKPIDKKGQKSVTETNEENIRLLSVSTDGTDKQAQSTKTVMNKTNDIKIDTSRVEHTNKDVKQEQNVDHRKHDAVNEKKQDKRTVEQKPHAYLEETETLIGTSRDHDTASPVKQTVTKSVVSRSHTPVSRTGVPSRPISKASIYTNSVHKPPSISKANDTASIRQSRASLQVQSETKSRPSISKTNDAASIRESKASLQVQSETKSKSESLYQQTYPKRAPSVVSIVSKANSTAQQSHKTETKDNVSVKDRDIVNGGTKVPEKTIANRSVSRTSVHTVNSVYQNNMKPDKRVSKTSVHMGDVVGQLMQKEKEKAVNEKSPYNQDSKMNSVQNSTTTLNKVPNSKHVSPSPSRVSKIDTKVNGYTDKTVNDDKSHQEPSVKRNVQISETVEVHTKVSDPKTGKLIHQKHVVENGLPDDGSTYVDEKMNREDFENRNKAQTREHPERDRSPGPTQARSKSRERKGPAPKKGKGKQPATRATKDRKVTGPTRKQGKSRFPDIDENDRTVSNARATPKTQTKRTVNYDEVETETIRTVTPSEKQGAAKWKDLVSKYLREPSPVVGKKEDLSVLQTKMDTDDSGSEADIFERAKRRYALDVEDESDDDDDE